MGSELNGVWLGGERYCVAYFLNFETDRVQRFVTKGKAMNVLGGQCRRMLGRYVAWFVNPADQRLMLRVGRDSYVLDGSLEFQHRVTWLGLLSTLVIDPGGRSERRVRSLTVARALMPFIDWTYDGLDELGDDFFIGFPELVASSENRERMIRIHSPTTGPWELLQTRTAAPQ